MNRAHPRNCRRCLRAFFCFASLVDIGHSFHHILGVHGIVASPSLPLRGRATGAERPRRALPRARRRRSAEPDAEAADSRTPSTVPVQISALPRERQHNEERGITPACRKDTQHGCCTLAERLIECRGLPVARTMGLQVRVTQNERDGGVGNLRDDATRYRRLRQRAATPVRHVQANANRRTARQLFNLHPLQGGKSPADDRTGENHPPLLTILLIPSAQAPDNCAR